MIVEYEGDQLVIPQLKTFPKKEYICTDVFCGIGGFSVAASLCGLKVLAAIELNPVNAFYHDLNFPEGKTFCADVTKISAHDIRNASGIENNEIHVCIISPPCQAFSRAGVRDMNDPRAKLLREGCRLIADLNPKYFVIENVRGLVEGKQKKFLEEAIAYLEEREYHVIRDYQLLNAKDFLVPQSRSRLFILGARKDLPLPCYPTKIDSPAPTVKDAIGDLPEIENYPELLERDWVEAEFGEPSNYAKMLGASGKGKRTLTSSRRTIHSQKVIERFSQTSANKFEPISRFFKLDWNGISNTLRAGSGSYTAVRPIHPNGRRVISIREAARLSSFPDDFVFSDNKLYGYRQVGNSVPPFLGRAVISEVVKMLDQL